MNADTRTPPANTEAGLDARAPWLVADIGGTHARFGLVAPGGGEVRHVRRLRGADFPGPAEAARAYLGEVAADLAAQGGEPGAPPRFAAFAVATAVEGDRIVLTNSPWAFSVRQVQAALGLDGLAMLNDFEALALSLPALAPHQLRAHGALPACRGTVAVLGPGTGLGVAGLVETPSGWHPVAGEGGHATLAAADDFEDEILRAVRAEFGHVSAERLLSGIGLPLLHRAVGQARGEPVQERSAQDIGSLGAAGTDAACARTLATFCGLLGSFAGNVALTLGARGGLFIGGGVVPHFADFFFASDFRRRFEDKGRFRPYLERVPTALIVEPHAALSGAAAAIASRLAGARPW